MSKAPPPINPIRVGRYTAPNAPTVPPPNWDKWGHMRDVELWEAVALSLNLEPDKLPVYLAAFERFGDDPFRICPQSFLDRLQVANSNCGISLGYRPVHKLKARCLVDLPAFGAWAVNQNIPDMPPKLAAMAATEPQAAPIVPINELTGLPFCEALEQPAYQKTPDYQARCKKALLVLNEISEVEKDRTNSFDERERKSQRLAALKVELAEINFPGDSQQKTIEPQATTPSPAPVLVETTEQRRARWLDWYGKGERGAVQRVYERELLLNPKADRSFIGKEIDKAKNEKAETKRGGAMFGQLVQDGKRMG